MTDSGNKHYSLEQQKSFLHLILLSEPEGYTNIQRILNDLKSEHDIDGGDLAYKCEYYDFDAFLKSPIMSKYCHVKEDGFTTHYSGVRDSRSDHIVEEIKAFHESERLKTAGKRPNGIVKSNPTGLNPRRQVGFLQRSESERSGIPRDPGSIPDSSTTNESDTQTVCKDQDEKAVQTEDETAHEIFATLKFLKEPYAKGQSIDRYPKPLYSAIEKMSLQYYGNLTTEKMIDEILSKFPNGDDIHNFEVHTVQHYNPKFNNLVEITYDHKVVPKGKYIVEMSLKGGMTRAQLEEKLQNSEAQLQQTSDKNKELEDDLRTLKATSEGTISRLQISLDERSVELYNSEVKNEELLKSNRNLKTKLGQRDLDRLKVLLNEFAENAEISQDLLNTMNAAFEAEQKRQSENVKNTEMSANANSDMFDIYDEDSGEEDE